MMVIIGLWKSFRLADIGKDDELCMKAVNYVLSIGSRLLEKNLARKHFLKMAEDSTNSTLTGTNS